MTDTPFGRQLLQAGSIDQAVVSEQESDRASQFADLDSFVQSLFSRMLKGERIVDVATKPGNVVHIELSGLAADQRKLVDELFGLDEMERRGAWFVPEVLSISPGHAQFPFHLTRNVRFGVVAVADDSARLQARSSADAVLVWATLEPWGRQLFRPIERSGFFSTQKVYSERLASWPQDRAVLQELGFDVQRLEPPAVTKVGRSQEQITTRRNLLATLSERSDQPLATRWRVNRLRALTAAYYAKADKAGRVLRRRALSKDVQPILCAYFGGDWLKFVEYLGEQPHPDEEILSGLAQTKLYIETRPAEQVAAAAGVTTQDAEAVLASFFRTAQPASPVEARLAVLKRYWQVMDELHANQRPGTLSLWGLVDDIGWFITQTDGRIHDAVRYQELLPADLLSDIERLWGHQVIEVAPDRIAMAFSPHQQLAQALGPALSFWHGCALTLWFVTQGPYSRTDLDGLKKYYGRDLSALDQLGFPVPYTFFEDMAMADKKMLGKPEQVWDEESAGHGITIQMSRGSRRSGFEKVRDLLTQHRRQWAAAHLDEYLRKTCETDIAVAVHEFRRTLANRGKAPTMKQFVKFAVGPANRWFGGNIRDLYSAFGETCPIQPVVVAKQVDRMAFARMAYRGFGGKDGDSEEQRGKNWIAQRLANTSVRYLMLEQALGRTPTERELGMADVEYAARELKIDSEKAWLWYLQVIDWIKSQVPVA